MVGSGESRRKEAVGMMALHEALRNVCINSDWTYSVFWTIRPRPRVRGGNGCKVGDDNGSLMLMWEDGFCRGSDCLDQMEREDLVRKAFSKMSIQLYNYGEGLMGKVASDKCHKWVFKEPTENETNVSNYWQSSFDALPSEWTDQFESGIQTVAVIQAGHGLLQLGSCKIIAEDLHFVLRMRHTFESLGYQSGYYLSQLFSSTRTISAPSTFPLKQHINTPIRPPPVFNWGSRPNPSANSLHAYPNFQNAAMVGGISHSSELAQAQTMENHHENDDIKWPNGLTIFSALTCQSDDSRLLFNADSLSSKSEHNQHAMNHDEKTSNPTSDSSNQDGFLSLESHFG